MPFTKAASHAAPLPSGLLTSTLIQRNCKKQAKSPASNDANNESGVCLCTLHCAKGLEYPIVFIPDINEDNIPHARAAVDADLEEERRLFYVGITRAKEHLHLYCVSEASGKEKFPSRFLEELNEM